MFKRYNVLFDVRIEDPKLHSHTPILDELGLYIQFPSLIVHSFKNFFWLNRELYSPYQKWTKHAEASSSCLPICLPDVFRGEDFSVELQTSFTIYLASVPLRRNQLGAYNNHPHWKCSQSDFVCFTCLQRICFSLFVFQVIIMNLTVRNPQNAHFIKQGHMRILLSCKLVPVHYRE